MQRPEFIEEIGAAFSGFPVVALLGPRQCGKTTLARAFSGAESVFPSTNYFDLEDPRSLARLSEPMLALERLQGLVVIDEIQRLPELFPVLRVLVDRENNACRFLILGSASRDLIQQGSESLAGRVRFLELTPFRLGEAGTEALSQLWLRGGFPRSFLSPDEPSSLLWRQEYTRTYLEQDIPALGIQIAPAALRRFWMMLTHAHGQIFNASEIGRSLGIGDTTAQRYLDVLTGTFMLRRLPAWFENIKKRQVKRPKVYFRDSGMFHYLSGIESQESLMTHPKLGASWEGFALEETIRSLKAPPEEFYFWGVHGQSELDLLQVRGGKRQGFEFKYADAPKMSRSMQQSIQLLGLEKLTVVVPGDADYPLSDCVNVTGLERFVD